MFRGPLVVKVLWRDGVNCLLYWDVYMPIYVLIRRNLFRELWRPIPNINIRKVQNIVNTYNIFQYYKVQNELKCKFKKQTLQKEESGLEVFRKWIFIGKTSRAKNLTWIAFKCSTQSLKPLLPCPPPSPHQDPSPKKKKFKNWIFNFFKYKQSLVHLLNTRPLKTPLHQTLILTIILTLNFDPHFKPWFGP